MHTAPGHRQLRGINRERRVFGAQATAFNQRTRGVIRHGGDHFGAGEQGAQATELRHAKNYAARAAKLGQVEVDVAAQVARERHHCVRTLAVFVECQRPRAIIAAQDFAGNVAQFLAFGIGRQIRGVADADGDFPGGQQCRHQQVVGTAHHHDNARRLLLQMAQQRWKQTELGIVRQADTKHIATARRFKLLGATDGPGNDVHRRLQLLEDRQGAGGRFHAATVAQQQRIIEQVTQTPERCTYRGLAHEQFLGDAGQVLFEHQRFENHQQVHVDATQIITVHRLGFLLWPATRTCYAL